MSINIRIDNDLSEAACLDAPEHTRVALPCMTRADLARVHETTGKMICVRFEGVTA